MGLKGLTSEIGDGLRTTSNPPILSLSPRKPQPRFCLRMHYSAVGREKSPIRPSSEDRREWASPRVSGIFGGPARTSSALARPKKKINALESRGTWAQPPRKIPIPAAPAWMGHTSVPCRGHPPEGKVPSHHRRSRRRFARGVPVRAGWERRWLRSVS